MRRMVAGPRLDDADVIITQLPAAQAISATWLNTVDTFGHRNMVSISSVNGCQFRAATNPRLPRARIIAALTRDCLLTSAQPMRRPVANPRRPAITQTINQTPLRAAPALSKNDQTVTGRAGR